MKVLIAVPCMDQVPAQFAQSLATLDKVGECGIAFQISSLIYTARNKLAMIAIEKECDYVLWLDSDMVFPRDTLKKMLENRDKGDIITGMYFRRVEPFHPCLFSKLEVNDQGGASDTLQEIPDEMFEVEGCGFGCVLTPVSIFTEMLIEYGDMFSPISSVGEDLSFCWRARQLGHKIMCDPSIPLGHVGHYTVDRGFYEAYKQAKGENK